MSPGAEQLLEQEAEPEGTETVGEHQGTLLGRSEEEMNTSSGDVLLHDWDIGKLIAFNAKLGNLCREEVYGILTCEPPMATSEYPRTRQSESGSFRQFSTIMGEAISMAALQQV